MAATAVADTLAEVRDFLVEKKARFWTDVELKDIYRHGVLDLWGSILDLHGEHYMVVNDKDVVLMSGASQLSGVPEDCFRVLLIEPRDTTSSGSSSQCLFTPRKFNHPEFIGARTQTAIDSGSTFEIFYHVSGVGAPIEAPKILIAPKISSDMDLLLAYCPTIVLGDYNPIPGESDNALKAWTLAYAMGKEAGSGARAPDAGWLQIYSTEKQLILTRLTPRQEQEPEVVADLFSI